MIKMRFLQKFRRRNRPLCCRVERDCLVIRIGVETLSFADEARRIYEYGETDLKITNPRGFADDVARELNREEENGDTPLCLLLDRMIERAAAMGSAHVEWL